MGEEDCFVLRVAADREEVMERNEGPAEVIRHVLYGYLSQKTGLLLYLEDSHLTRVVLLDDDDDDDERVVYWETSIGSSIGDYREVDGLLIAQEGRTMATVFRFSAEQQQQQQQRGGGAGEQQYCSSYYSRTRLEEVWRIDDVVFNVPGLSFDSFLPPSDLFPPGPPRSS